MGLERGITNARRELARRRRADKLEVLMAVLGTLLAVLMVIAYLAA